MKLHEKGTEPKMRGVRVHKLPGSTRVVVLTTNLVESRVMDKKKYFECMHKILFQTLEGLVEIVIKLHPEEHHKKEYEKLLHSIGLRHARVTQSGGKDELYQDLSEADLVVCVGGSTAAVEALMLDKPVIVIGGFRKKIEDEAREEPYRQACVVLDKNKL